jgi:hypothetical protein
MKPRKSKGLIKRLKEVKALHKIRKKELREKKYKTEEEWEEYNLLRSKI